MRIADTYGGFNVQTDSGIDLTDPGLRVAAKYARLVLKLLDLRDSEGVRSLQVVAVLLKRSRASYRTLRRAVSAFDLGRKRWLTVDAGVVCDFLGPVPTWAEIRAAGEADRRARLKPGILSGALRGPGLKRCEAAR